MIEFKLKREESEKANLDDWQWGDDDDDFFEKLSGLITKRIEKRLDVVFSETGATVRLDIGINHRHSDLILECDIELQECEAYVEGSASIRDLVIDASNNCEDDERNELAAALRALADEIAPNVEFRGTAKRSFDGSPGTQG